MSEVESSVISLKHQDKKVTINRLESNPVKNFWTNITSLMKEFLKDILL